jgi:predicted nucleotide-binding protein
MAIRQHITRTQARTFMLNINNNQFKHDLTERINIGEELYSRQIQNDKDYNKLENDCKLWDDYNSEMLKQVFNYPDNDYVVSYNRRLGQIEVLNNPVQTQKNLIHNKLENLKALLNKADLIKSEVQSNNIMPTTTKVLSKNEVFIVHGHDKLALTETARFIEKLGLNPIILHEQANSGKTIIEKIEEYSNVGFGIVLYTPCDKGCKKGEESNLSNRARQNVVFEHGYLIGKIGRENVCALVKGNIEKPNDISGVVYVPMNSDESWHLKIAKELKSSGYDIDLNKLI